MKSVILQQHSIHTGNLVLVNAQTPVPYQADKDNLMPVNETEQTVLLNCHVVTQLSGLMEQLDGWRQISAVSGWRSMQEQQDIYYQSLQENGLEFTNQYVALPGHSEHQTGLAVDLALKQDNIDFICPDFPYMGICQDFREKAILAGFIERYPHSKENVTGIAHEPWHFRYVGTPHAEIMEEHGLVLEEYIDFLRQYRYGENHYSYCRKQGAISVSFLEAESSDTQFEIDDNITYSVSGNNMDGYVITEWRP